MKILYLLPLWAIIIAAICAAPGQATPVSSNPAPVMILNSETYCYIMLLDSVIRKMYLTISEWSVEYLKSLKPMELVDWFARLTKEERGEFEKNMSDGLELEALFIKITGGLAIAAQEKQLGQMQREPVKMEPSKRLPPEDCEEFPRC